MEVRHGCVAFPSIDRNLARLVSAGCRVCVMWADAPKCQTSRVGRYSLVGGAVAHITRENATEQTGMPVVGGYQSTRGSTLTA